MHRVEARYGLFISNRSKFGVMIDTALASGKQYDSYVF